MSNNLNPGISQSSDWLMENPVVDGSLNQDGRLF
jgi:hypothetical protein